MKATVSLYSLICFIIGIAALLNPLVYASDWPQFYHDPAHTSCTQDEGPATNNLTWSRQIGPAISSSYLHISSPAVVDGRVYTGSTGPNVFCFDAQTGDTIWQKSFPGDRMWSSPAVVDGRVIVGGWDSGTIYCLDANTGDSLWAYDISGNIEMGATVADGRVFFSAWYNNYIYCLDLYTGNLLWRASPDPGYMFGHGGLSAVHDSLVFVGATEYPVGDTKFYAFKEYPSSPPNGEIEWAYTVATYYQHQPLSVHNGRVFGSVDQGGRYCMKEHPTSPPLGELIYQWSGYGDPSCISLEGDTMYYGEESAYVFSRNATNGNLIWQSIYLNSHTGIGAITVTPSRLYGGTAGGSGGSKIRCYEKTTGDTLWSYQTNGRVTSTPAVSNGMMFAVSQDGYIYAFGTWIGVEEEDPASYTSEVMLFHNSPNPITHETEIIFQISVFGYVSLRVYDITGKLVEILVDKPLKTGEHKIRWSPEITSGIYFLRLQAGDFEVIKKLTLIR